MKERLIQLLDLEQLSPSKFADIIGVQRSSVSHVISGRNNPSFDFLQKTLNAFPGLNAEWLMLGKGTMYEQMGRPATGNLFEAQTKRIEPPGEESEATTDTAYESEAVRPEGVQRRESLIQSSEKKEISIDKESVTRKISRVILFYDDDTFVSFEPS